MRVLTSKWIIQAIVFGQSNIQVLLRYRILQLQPSCHGFGAHPLFGCSLKISQTKVGQKFDTSSLSCGR